MERSCVASKWQQGPSAASFFVLFLMLFKIRGPWFDAQTRKATERGLNSQICSTKQQQQQQTAPPKWPFLDVWLIRKQESRRSQTNLSLWFTGTRFPRRRANGPLRDPLPVIRGNAALVCSTSGTMKSSSQDNSVERNDCKQAFPASVNDHQELLSLLFC